jgi:nickel-dependent lactate racemase
MKFEIPYGKGYKSIQINDVQIAGVLEPETHDVSSTDSQQEIIRRALLAPIGTPPLRELAKDAQRFLIITSDHTRPVPSRLTLPVILAHIYEGNPNAHIKILIATGCHREPTQAELYDKFGEDTLKRCDIECHNSFDADSLVYKGILPSGGELRLNKLVDWADIILAEGFIEPHFFAGFSGGRKSILPGIASSQTVLANHCAEFIASPYAVIGNLKNNPIHEDMVYAARKVNLAFILNVTLNSAKEVVRAFAGDAEAAHEAGCEYLAKVCGVDAVRADIVVTSNSGYPLDQNIYQAVKGMTAAEACVNQGGVIIIFAKCEDGHGGQAFYDWFASAQSVQEVADKIVTIPRNATIPDQWQAQILARVLLKSTVIIIADPSQRENIQNMHMKYADSFEAAMGMAQEITGRQSKITVIPDGVGVIVK